MKLMKRKTELSAMLDLMSELEAKRRKEKKIRKNPLRNLCSGRAS